MYNQVIHRQPSIEEGYRSSDVDPDISDVDEGGEAEEEEEEDAEDRAGFDGGVESGEEA